MAGIFRGMVDDAQVLLRNSQADVWVVQKIPTSLTPNRPACPDDVYRSILGMPGATSRQCHVFFTMQVQHQGKDTRVMVVAGFESGQPGAPPSLIAGRHVTRSHYEAVADVKAGFKLGEKSIRRNEYIIVGLSQHRVIRRRPDGVYSAGGCASSTVPERQRCDCQRVQ